MRILGLILAVALVVLGILSGSGLGNFIDTPSAIIVLVGGLGIYLFSGSGLVILARSAFQSSLSSSEIDEGIKSWRRMRESLWSAAWIGFIIGLIAMGQHYTYAESLGPGLATALIVVFYACFLNYVICRPIQRNLEDEAERA